MRLRALLGSAGAVALPAAAASAAYAGRPAGQARGARLADRVRGRERATARDGGRHDDRGREPPHPARSHVPQDDWQFSHIFEPVTQGRGHRS
jgi:hypothetical protein